MANNFVQLTNVLLTLSTLLISLTCGLHLEPQLNGQNGIQTEALNSNSNFQSDAVVVLPRQDDEEDDDGSEESADNGQRQQVINGVGNIITGALSLNPVKVLKGAFGFADKDVQENILNVILGQAPPSQTKAKTTDATLGEEIETTPEQEPEPEFKITTKVTTGKPQVIIRNFRNRTTTTQPTTPSTKKPRATKTTRAQQLPGEEDDEEYGDR